MRRAIFAAAILSGMAAGNALACTPPVSKQAVEARNDVSVIARVEAVRPVAGKLGARITAKPLRALKGELPKERVRYDENVVGCPQLQPTEIGDQVAVLMRRNRGRLTVVNAQGVTEAPAVQPTGRR